MRPELTVTVLSDTHGLHEGLSLPGGDVLIFAGDLMTSGWKVGEVLGFAKWFMSKPHKHKILVAGNHDRLFELDRYWVQSVKSEGIHYLEDSGVDIEGWKFWGSPYTPEFNNWAFNTPRDRMSRHWDLIPDDTDVLITHGPPFGIGDSSDGNRFGDMVLRKRVFEVAPKFHFFGHIHNGRTQTPVTEDSTVFHSVSICNEQYKAVHPAVTVVLKD